MDIVWDPPVVAEVIQGHIDLWSIDMASHQTQRERYIHEYMHVHVLYLFVFNAVCSCVPKA